MKITVSHMESNFNRATRKTDKREVIDGFSVVPVEVEKALKASAIEYRCSVAEMVALALRYYFGDGADHIQCEYCDFWRECCTVPEHGEQTTIPILDKGMVVVGLSASDQGV